MSNIIISDTSCLISLSKINKLDLLKQLYVNVIITQEVKNEQLLPIQKQTSTWCI